jgi:hypothetical protein
MRIFCPAIMASVSFAVVLQKFRAAFCRCGCPTWLSPRDPPIYSVILQSSRSFRGRDGCEITGLDRARNSLWAPGPIRSAPSWCGGRPPVSRGRPPTRGSCYLMIFVTRPAPTVRPPSRMANLRPSSIAMGWMSWTVISVLSPGMTISVPSGRVTTPVTSVVRK